MKNVYQTGDVDFIYNIINTSTWINDFEANGAVFLPTAGVRDVTSVLYHGTNGYYWSASWLSGDRIYTLRYSNTTVNAVGSDTRAIGRSVRLVQDVE